MSNLSNLDFSPLSDADMARLYCLNDELLYFCDDNRLPVLMCVYEELQGQIEDEICARFVRSV